MPYKITDPEKFVIFSTVKWYPLQTINELVERLLSFNYSSNPSRYIIFDYFTRVKRFAPCGSSLFDANQRFPAETFYVNSSDTTAIQTFIALSSCLTFRDSMISPLCQMCIAKPGSNNCFFQIVENTKRLEDCIKTLSNPQNLLWDRVRFEKMGFTWNEPFTLDNASTVPPAASTVNAGQANLQVAVQSQFDQTANTEALDDIFIAIDQLTENMGQLCADLANVKDTLTQQKGERNLPRD